MYHYAQLPDFRQMGPRTGTLPGRLIMESSVPLFARVLEAENFIRQRLPISLSQCSIGIICGSGLGSLSEAIAPSPRCELEYSAIPYFPRSSGSNTLYPSR